MTNPSGSPHWKENDLIDRLYGLEPDAAAGLDARHLDACAECAQAWAALASSRAMLLAAPPPPLDERLRVQRLAIWSHIERGPRAILWRAIPVSALALLLTVGVALHQTPAPRTAPVEITTIQSVSDTQLFTELASIVNQESPRAAEPIQALFSGAMADDNTSTRVMEAQ